MDFPIIGPNGQVWTLTEQQLESWREVYSSLDLDSELQKAKGWLLGNPTRRKTARGMLRFLAGWFNRALSDQQEAKRQAVRRATPPTQRAERWWQECQRLHGGNCHSPEWHRIKMVQEQDHAKNLA